MRARRSSTPEPLGLAAALVPVVALVGLLGLSFFLFGDEAASGPNQVALVFCSILAITVAWRHGHSIDDLRDAAVASVTAGLPAIFILLAVGALIGTWALGGTLIAMVYYGLQLLSPDYFYPTACLICLVGRRLDRQLLDRRRHPRDRADGRCARDGARPRRSPPAR